MPRFPLAPAKKVPRRIPPPHLLCRGEALDSLEFMGWVMGLQPSISVGHAKGHQHHDAGCGREVWQAIWQVLH